VLKKNLAEEKATDAKLTAMAEQRVNPRATPQPRRRAPHQAAPATRSPATKKKTAARKSAPRRA
jgi:hypothetical protein